MGTGSFMEIQFRHSIRFVLDGEIIELENVDPTRTVLQFLREDLKRLGTKEGCAEGDCGACTVVLVELDHSATRLQARAINSCIQFLSTLDGKELVTVESLADADGTLHPVQKALVDCHGSQCGFCTPGFVMSLFAVFKNQENPSRRDIDEALAGNLCRCTGYRPIVDAATRMYAGGNYNDVDDWALSPAAGPAGKDEARRVNVLKSLQSPNTLNIQGFSRKYFAPRTLDELSAIYAKFPQSVLLAGGTDVGLWVTKQLRNLETVIHTGNVTELNQACSSASHVEIGAGVPLSDAMELIRDHYPALEELFVRFASPPIRNAATLGGNIANGSPIGDSLPALLVLDTVLLLRSDSGTRSVALNDFYLAYMQNALQESEFIEKILIPLPVEGEQIASYKVSKRFDQDISSLCGAYRLVLNDGQISDVKIAYGGMAAVPKRAVVCEEFLQGKMWTEDVLQGACQAIVQDFTPVSDFRSSATYRQHVAQNLLRRFYLETNGDTQTRVYSYGR